MGDLISRQAVLDSLKEHRALYCDNTPETFSKLSYAEKSRVDELDTEIATIINLPSVENKGEWIPVTEKLPKDHEEVLIYLSANRITIGLYNSHVLPFAPYKPIGWGVNAQTAVHNFCSDDVVAWMPLPEPYKAERGE